VCCGVSPLGSCFHSLIDNSLGDAGACVLAAVKRARPELKMELEWNGIGTAGLRALTGAVDADGTEETDIVEDDTLVLGGA
jgi:hypothetical protein